MKATPDLQTSVQAGYNYLAKLHYKSKEAEKLRVQIKEYLQGEGVYFSDDKVIDYTTNNDVQQGFKGFSYTEVLNDKTELLKMYKRLLALNYTIVAMFSNGDEKAIQPMLHMFTMHRLCPVWNWRKSNIIRNKYKQFLQATGLPFSRKQAIHVVLTMPHPNGLYNGKRFYIDDLVYSFRLLRKQNFFKKSVYGGEYGIEVKKNKENGYHIHLHSLTYLNEGESVNEFRTNLHNAWKRIVDTENKYTRLQVHAESLYYYKRDTSGAWIMQEKTKERFESWDDNDMIISTTERKLVRKKFYIANEIKDIEQRTDITDKEKNDLIIEKHLGGVLECIKYHFKADTFYYDTDTRQYDVETINEVLTQTKGIRLYDRFGAFHAKSANADTENVYHLSFSDLDDEKHNIVTEKIQIGQDLTNREKRFAKVFELLNVSNDEIQGADADDVIFHSDTDTLPDMPKARTEHINPFTLQRDDNYRVGGYKSSRVRFVYNKKDTKKQYKPVGNDLHTIEIMQDVETPQEAIPYFL